MGASRRDLVLSNTGRVPTCTSEHTNIMAKTTWLLRILPCCILLCTAAQAAPQLSDQVRIGVEEDVRTGATPSLVIGLIDGDSTAVYGFGTVNGAVPDGDTVYEIGSVTKTFTALLLAKAVQAKTVTLDDPVAKLLPGYKIPEFEGTPITLRDLATQSSGLPRMPSNFFPGQMENPYVDYGTNELKEFLTVYHLPRKPGAQFEYSNLGLGLLGVALSEQEHQSYPEMVQQQIAEPLGMRSTGVALTTAMRQHLAPGHHDNGKPAGNWDLDALAGAGAIRSDVSDMMRYLQAFMQAQTMDDGPFALTTKALRDTSINNTRIGLAWLVRQEHGQTVIWHNGMTGGYASFVGFTSDGKHGVVILGNIAHSFDEIGMQVLVPTEKTETKEVSLESAELAQYIGDYELAPDFVLRVRSSPTGLTAQATGQAAFSIYPRAHDEFFLRAVDAQLSFLRDASGKVTSVVLHQNGNNSPGKKVAEKSADTAKVGSPKRAPRHKEITLKPAVLASYVGQYQLNPNFFIRIAQTPTGLTAQGSDQEAAPIYASARDKFFLRNVDAQLSFDRDASGKVVALVLHQNGQDMPANRVAE